VVELIEDFIATTDVSPVDIGQPLPDADVPIERADGADR
jgi:hypothetical protein